MAITVDTRKYLASHQRSPRGRGGWLFEAEVPASRERGRISHERTTVTLQVTDHYPEKFTTVGFGAGGRDISRCDRVGFGC